MDSIEVIRKLHQTELNVANEVFDPWPGNANNYVQYKRRAGGKIHYEVYRRGNDSVDVRLDDERSNVSESDGLRRQLRQLADRSGKFSIGKGKDLIIRHNNAVQCEGRVFSKIKIDIQMRLNDLYNAFERILADINEEDFKINKRREEEQVVSEEDLRNFAEDCKAVEAKMGTQFSIFDVLKISRMEIRHSNMLGWLLDPNENHGLDGKVLDGILKEVDQSYASEDLRTFSVYREQDSIDILLVSDALNKVVAIENKIGAKEGIRKTKKSDDVESQLTTYEKILAEKYPNHRKLLLFLTPEGDAPSKDTWIPISYATLIDVVEKIFKQVYISANSNKAILIKDYIKTIRKDVLMEVSKELVEICREVYNTHKAAVKAVRQYGMTNVGEVVAKKLKELEGENEMGLKHVGGKKFRLESLDKILPPESNASCWWGSGAYCCWVDVNENGSKMCCSVGVVNSDHKNLAEFIKKLCPHFEKKSGATSWIALPWNARGKGGKTNNKNWKDFDESSTESIENAVTDVVKQLWEKVTHNISISEVK